jgi:hypothetical protein
MIARLLLLLFAVCQVHYAQASYVPVTFCGLSFHHEKANPKHISVYAEYVNAFPHGLLLTDRRCEPNALRIDFADKDLDPSLAFIKRHMLDWPSTWHISRNAAA